MLPLQGNLNSSGLQLKSGVLTSISSRQCSAISGRPLHEQTNLRPTVCS